MKIEVRFFASLVDRTGCSNECVDVREGTDVEGLWQILCERHPALGRTDYRPMAACDLGYAGWDRCLDDVREVAFLPPMSGG